MQAQKRLLVGAVLALFAVGKVNAGAVVGATEFTQILNNSQLFASYGEQVQQTLHQFNTYQKMLQNLKQSIPSALLDQQALQLWNNSNMTQTFRNLRTIVVNGQKVSYSLSNQDQTFKRLHPGYGSEFNSKDQYQDWSDDTHAAVANSMAVAGVQADSIDTEQEMVRELQSRAQSADGQLSMLKAGNDIGVAMVGQMQQLRQLQIAQMTAQGHYLKNQTAQQDKEKQGMSVIYKNIRSSKYVQGTRTVQPSDAQ